MQSATSPPSGEFQSGVARAAITGDFQNAAASGPFRAESGDMFKSLFAPKNSAAPAAPPPACTCGAPLFRDNTSCIRCGALVGYLPDRGWLLAFAQGPARTPNKDRNPTPSYTNPHPALAKRSFKTCSGRATAHQCNWMIDASDAATQCLSCSLTRTIPDLSQPGAPDHWAEAERAKRQTIGQLLRLRLPVRSRHSHADGMWFDFLEPLPGAVPVLTGHANGLITLNLVEADAIRRARIQEEMGESFRTLAGHMRHELAHYYWQLFSQNAEWLQQFRKVFGDERADYAQALDRHHKQGAPANWSSQFISPYASSHPWEDWAETFAHYLHMEEALNTADRLGLDLQRLRLRTDSFDRASLQVAGSPALTPAFLHSIDRWVLLSLAANELNAALGHPHAYPFIFNPVSVSKLHAVHQSLQKFAAPG